MNHRSIQGRSACFSLLLFGILVLVAACGTSNGTGSTSSSPIVGSSPTSSATGTPLPASPTSAPVQPSPTHVKPTPTPTHVAHTPTPTPTHVPTPSPTPKPTPSPTPSPTITVLITLDSSGNFTFSPSSVTITPGTTVIWKNMAQVTHTSTSDTGAWDSGPIAFGSSFRFKFTQAGTFKYHCAIHPFMMASITVS